MPIDETIFKAYDIRGIYPNQLDENIAYLIGGALANYIGKSPIAVGRDMRTSSEALFDALSKGIRDGGCDVMDIGLISTDGMYFTVGKFALPAGIMITASHNPAQYNGFKICRQNAIPLSGTEGLPEIKKTLMQGAFRKATRLGHSTKKDVLQDYVDFALSFVDVSQIKPFTIAVDAGNGMAGATIPPLFKKLPCKLVPLYFELDGTFPNHLASPIEQENTAALRQLVAERNDVELGVAFDGDADRMFLVDDLGRLVDASMVTAMVAKNLLTKHPGETIIYNIITSHTVPEIVQEMGGTAVRTPVGHAIIKPIMRKHNAIFGGEHSGHFYFRDNWFADSGLIAFLIALELISQSGKRLSELVAELDRYYRSGEINTRVADRKNTIDCVAKRYERLRVVPDWTDGVTFEFSDWWFNLRPSNTEPLIRLNLEAKTEELMQEKRDEVLKAIEMCS